MILGRMRSILAIVLLAVSLGLTATCLLIIRLHMQRQIRAGLASDLQHSLTTFQNLEVQRDQMLSREAALLGDLPSLKALMASQDQRTIEDGSSEFWKVGGTDLFALADPEGTLLTHSTRGEQLSTMVVQQTLRPFLREPAGARILAFGHSLYEISAQPLYFGPAASGSQLGFVIIGSAVDERLAREVSQAAAADVVFLSQGRQAATTLAPGRLAALLAQSESLRVTQTPRWLRLGAEEYLAASVPLSAAGDPSVQLLVLKSYDQASFFLQRLNRWIEALGFATLIIGGLLAAAISRTITRPLESLVAGTRALGRGDFDFQFSSTAGAQEIRELGRAFDRMRGELRRTQLELLASERLATIGSMASSVSHDLRHHLSAIYANAEFMSLDNTSSSERRDLLIEVRDAIHAMTDLIESLLLFSQTGHLLCPRPELLEVLIARMLHSVESHPEARNVQIVFESHRSIEACVDGKKLSRALYNLVLNACQAARRSSSPRVDVSLTEDQEAIRIGISDTGPGVPQSIRHTLFQPFVSAGKENGTGLGLTLAHHIAQEHGGQVLLEQSGPGHTLFTLVLPKAAPDASRLENRLTAITEEST